MRNMLEKKEKKIQKIKSKYCKSEVATKALHSYVNNIK